jgi:stage V sporulation protein SpoVS
MAVDLFSVNVASQVTGLIQDVLVKHQEVELQVQAHVAVDVAVAALAQ